jgi:hypothetical protein
MRDLRNVGIGVMLGICVMLAVGLAAPNNPNGTRFHVTPTKAEGGNYEFFIHDLQTNKVYHRTIGSGQLASEGTLVEDILKQR